MRPWVTVQEGHNPKIKVDESEGHYSKPLHHVHSKWPTQKNRVFQNRQFSIFFCENAKAIENWRFWKTLFFWVGHFQFSFKSFFSIIPMKNVKVYWLARMGQNFDDYSNFQPKITHPKHFSRQCKSVTFLILFWNIFPIYMALLGRLLIFGKSSTYTVFYVINITSLHTTRDVY